MRYIFTSAAANYSTKVSLLYESVKRHHPEVTFVLLAIERSGSCDHLHKRTFDEIVYADELELGQQQSWLFKHDIVELSTALKPACMLRLLDRKDAQSVTYIDPDIVLFSRIDEVLTFAPGEAAVLTPHICKPEATDRGVRDHEISCLKHGLYNLGFLSVNNVPGGRQVAQWWHDRVAAYCISDTTTGLFTDQKWMDFLPIFFDGIRVEKSPRFNVAPWNIAQRHLYLENNTWYVEKQPLGFYHFTGFDSGAHANVSEHYGVDSPDVFKLIRWYKTENAQRKEKLGPLPPWSFGEFANGLPVEKRHRLIYRARTDLEQAFPTPFDTPEDANSFFNWCRFTGPVEFPDVFSAAEGTAPPPKRGTGLKSMLGRLL